MSKKNVVPRFQQFFCRGLQSTATAMKNQPKWARGIRSAAPATRNQHHVQNLKMTTLFHKTRLFDPFKTSSKFTKYCACHAKWLPKALLTFTRTTPAMRMKKYPMSRTCHAKQRFRSQKCPKSATPATKTGHSSNNQHHGALVKRHLRVLRRTGQSQPLWRACAIEVEMDISPSHNGAFTREFTAKKPEAKLSTLI